VDDCPLLACTGLLALSVPQMGAGEEEEPDSPYMAGRSPVTALSSWCRRIPIPRNPAWSKKNPAGGKRGFPNWAWGIIGTYHGDAPKVENFKQSVKNILNAQTETVPPSGTTARRSVTQMLLTIAMRCTELSSVMKRRRAYFGWTSAALGRVSASSSEYAASTPSANTARL